MINHSPLDNNIHFIGIGGSGMSGIAEVLHNLGYPISGSDITQNTNTIHLKDIGCNIFIGHNVKHITGAKTIVVSTAIKEDNLELTAAKQQHIPVVTRAEMLAELMRFQYGIAIAGTHGKTTTTSLIAYILTKAKLDPTYIIGGILNSSGKNAKLGLGNYLVAEADESDSSFLHLQPKSTIITNIDNDHMATYGHDIAQLDKTFLQFISNLPFDGLCVVCLDDKGILRIYDKINRPLLSYGFNKEADVSATNFSQQQSSLSFQVVLKKNNQLFQIKASLIGRHNAQNILGAVAVALSLNIPTKTIQQAISSFSGVSRRLEQHTLHIHQTPIVHFDDYGHHPQEIKAVISGLRLSHPHHRLITIFQPHRYSRTYELFDDFSHELAKTDILVLWDIYPAGETPITNISSLNLANHMRQLGTLDPIVLKKPSDTIDFLTNISQKNDLILTLGAGNISMLSKQLVQQYGL